MHFSSLTFGYQCGISLLVSSFFLCIVIWRFTSGTAYLALSLFLYGIRPRPCRLHLYGVKLKIELKIFFTYLISQDLGSRIWQVGCFWLQGSAHTGPALTPAEVLVAIHDINPEKDGVPLKKVSANFFYCLIPYFICDLNLNACSWNIADNGCLHHMFWAANSFYSARVSQSTRWIGRCRLHLLEIGDK